MIVYDLLQMFGEPVRVRLYTSEFGKQTTVFDDVVPTYCREIDDYPVVGLKIDQDTLVVETVLRT